MDNRPAPPEPGSENEQRRLARQWRTNGSASAVIERSDGAQEVHRGHEALSVLIDRGKVLRQLDRSTQEDAIPGRPSLGC